jgi:hypothetical protein
VFVRLHLALFPAGGPFLPSLSVNLNISIIHPAAASFAEGAARTPGFAAAAQDASKRRAYRQMYSALPFVPMSVESLVLTLLGDLAAQAVQAGGASWLSRCVGL